MSHCPRGGAGHKKFYVRLTAQIVQCISPECEHQPFVNSITEKDKDWEFWSTMRPAKPSPDEGELNSPVSALLEEEIQRMAAARRDRRPFTHVSRSYT